MVLLVGSEHRKNKRSYPISSATKIGNTMAAIFLLISLNVLVTFFLLLALYLFKSALGIDLFPGSFVDFLQSR
ncbi:hypothetical protein K4A83_19585 [Spirulina subsalsa FACHB-351]|uniref:Uncharacterized protein n=1 Tax=Spirulina subsalsa FACHB-351 TaxID=234711 RepID=A0ABT3LBF8_9CYAN|nr:hypothetical protein [Spirulina subsalsa]MCW6038457.1 hypothetical protein [Spirulina subsalsa FACHB-351]